MISCRWVGVIEHEDVVVEVLHPHLAFLAVEGLYDWVLKFPLRETKDWRLLVPYVALYIASSYGFVVMPWKFYWLRGRGRPHAGTDRRSDRTS